MTRVQDTISYWHMPLGFTPPKDRAATVDDVISWRNDANPNPLQRASYLTLGGIVTAFIGGLIGIIKENAAASVAGVILFLAGIGTTVLGLFGGPDFALHKPVRKTDSHAEDHPPDLKPNVTVIETKVEIDKESTPELVKCLENKDLLARDRERAARILGQRREVSAIDTLILHLSDSLVSVQNACAWALGEIRDRRALEPLHRIAEDSSGNISKKVIATAKAALNKIKKK